MKNQNNKKAGRTPSPVSVRIPFSTSERKKILKMIDEHKTFLSRHRKIGVLKRNLSEGKKISLVHHRQLIETATDAESVFTKSVVNSIDLLGGKAELKSFENQFLKSTDDFRMTCHPAFFPAEVKEQLKKMGYKEAELIRYHYVLMNTPVWDMLRKDIAKKSLKKIFGDCKKVIDQVQFPESTEALRADGLIPVSGSEDAVPYIVGGAAIVVGAVATVFGAPEIGIPLMAAGAGLIANEAIQDLTGTQDDEWEIAVSSSFSLGSGAQNPSGQTSYVSERFIGNFSRTKMEVHKTHCQWLSKANPSHLRDVSSLDEAKSLGLDRCAKCLGGSTR